MDFTAIITSQEIAKGEEMVQRNGLGGGAVVDTSSISLRNWAN